MEKLRLVYLLGIALGLTLVIRHKKYKEKLTQQKVLENHQVERSDKQKAIEQPVNTREELDEGPKKEQEKLFEVEVDKQNQVYIPEYFEKVSDVPKRNEAEEEIYNSDTIDSQAIEVINIIKARGIHELLHFTNMENLYSIINNGFLSVELQRSKGIKAKINDEDRFDKKLNATSFSIGFPNYKMLYSLRNKERNSRWVIVTINPNILYLHKENIYYCENNGASREMILKSNDELKEITAFRNMFKESMDTRYYGKINRSELNIPMNYTTDPQAEVLIEGYIPNKFIKSIYVRNYDDFYFIENIIKNNLYDYNVDIMPSYFSARSDYEFWQRR